MTVPPRGAGTPTIPKRGTPAPTAVPVDARSGPADRPAPGPSADRPGSGRKTATGGRRRRWHRIAVPVGVAVLLLTISGITHAIDQPDAGDPGFLSPTNTDEEGGSRLADKLRAQGVTVERTTSTRETLTIAAFADDELTLFVPTPALVHPRYLPYLANPGERVRVVLVDPPRRVLEDANLPLTTAGRRWAARTVGTAADGRPCVLPEVAAAGSAAALLQRYASPPGLTNYADYCYAGGLVRTRWRDNDIVVVGASDPFRNDRIGERGNAGLATGLLSTHDRVVWLDLTGPEPPPPARQGDPRTSSPDGTDPYGEGEPERGGDDPAYGDPDESTSEQDDAQSAAPDPPNPLWDLFPTWFWALLAQLALALLLAVLWRARRLGPVVAEPLPVTVPSAETVLGRGRLYQRARAHRPAADTLRAATLHRLRQSLNVPPDAGPDDVAGAVAARTGRDPADLHDLLYGPTPQTNRELLDLAQALDVLAGLAGNSPLDPNPHHRPIEGEAR